jgi:NADPH:quinone reductase-like Zn-dependent oxidoreductase
MDWKIRAGYMREQMPLALPTGTGIDTAGVVDEVGEGVSDVEIGAAVFGTGTASWGGTRLDPARSIPRGR